MRISTLKSVSCCLFTLGLIACGNASTTNENGATLVSIVVMPANPSIAASATQQFTATGTYSDSTTQDITGSAIWSSSDTSKATMSNAGMATGVAEGATTISASSGKVVGTTVLTVTAQTAALISIEVTPANPSIVASATQQFTATGTYSDSTTQNITGSVTWSTANTIKATISNAGMATGIAAGTATISATSGIVVGSTTLTVTAQPATLVSIEVTPANSNIVIGATQQFMAIGTYSNSSTQNITTLVTWNSSDTTKATITTSGLATAVAAGSCNITATSGIIGGSTTLTSYNGNFVVTWTSTGQDGGGDGIFGQRFNAAGIPTGSEFQINSTTANNQSGPAIASDANGNFIVTWTSTGQDGSGDGIFGQRFNAAGIPTGSEFQINSTTANNQSGPAIASDANGNFIVTWTSTGQDGSGDGIFGQRFNAAGIPTGSEFQINSTTANNQSGPAIASDANGNFIVTWTSTGQDGSGDGIFGQRFNAAGIPTGSEFQINSTTANNQSGPAIASDANGNFIVTWTSTGQDGSGDGIFGQRFNAAGIPTGSEFQINSTTANNQSGPAIASDANGNFIVTWTSTGQDGSGDGIFGQRFNAAGIPTGSEFQINSTTANKQTGSALQ